MSLFILKARKKIVEKNFNLHCIGGVPRIFSAYVPEKNKKITP